MAQFCVFTKLMPFFQQNDEILVFLTSIFYVTSLMTLSRQFFCISTFTYDNSLTILKISSSSFKPFRSYSLFFFELYQYNKISKNVIHLWTPCITHPGKSYPSATRAKFGLKLEPKCYPSATRRIFIKKFQPESNPRIS